MISKILTFLLVVVFLSGCSLQNSVSQDSTKDTDSESAYLTPTPTLTTDDSLDSIEADLESTIILEEDLGDL